MFKKTTKWEFFGSITEEKLLALCGEVEVDVGEDPWWATVRLLDFVLVSIYKEVDSSIKLQPITHGFPSYSMMLLMEQLAENTVKSLYLTIAPEKRMETWQ